jgi:hypothetical protein
MPNPKYELCADCGKKHAPIRPGTDVTECGQCGKHHVSPGGNKGCTAHQRHTNNSEPCGQHPIPGGHVCRFHGGDIPQVRAAAAERIAKKEAEAELKRFGVKVVVDPGEELLDLIAHTAGYVRFLRTRVDQLMHEDMTWGVSRVKEGGEDYGTTYEAKPNVWIQMLDHWTEKHSRLLVEALKLRLDERRVKIAEAQGDALIRVLDGVLAELGHNPHDVKTAEIVAKHLRLVS